MLKRYFQYPSTWMAIFTFLVFGLLGYFAISFGMLFVKDFAANLFATFIGVMVGIPVAMYLSHYQETKTEEQKTWKILNLLRIELKLNLSELVKWKSRESLDLEAGTLGIKLNDEAWKAFSEGGELEWIKEPSVLFALSNVYYEIKVVQSYSEKHYDINIMGGRRVTQASMKYINDHLKEAVVNAINTIGETIPMLH